MNFSPDQMRMASDMMKNMKPEDMQNMMRNFQQNPDMMDQARRMMSGSSPSPSPSYPSSVDTSPLTQIIGCKDKGNTLFKQKDFASASVKYLECILEIEELREKLSPIQTSDPKFLVNLNELELACRNNYCVTKSNLGEFNLVISHCQKVLLIDPKNSKALFNESQAFYNLEEFEKSRNSMDLLIKIIGNGIVEEKVESLRQKIKEHFFTNKDNKESKIKDSINSNNSEQIKDKEDERKPQFKDLIKKNEIKEKVGKIEKEEIIKQEDSKQEVVNKSKTEPEINTNKEIKSQVLNSKINKLPTNKKENDFEINDEKEIDELEKLFKNTKKREEKKEKPTENKLESVFQQKENPIKVNIEKEVLSKNNFEIFFNKYWQLFLGILLGLILAKLLKA